MIIYIEIYSEILAGICCGTLLALVGIIGGLVWLFRKNKKNKE